MEEHGIALPSKPTAMLSVHTRRWESPDLAAADVDLAAPLSSVLVVFLNGLGLPQDSWFPVADAIPALLEQRALPVASQVLLMSYDRYGQGRSTDKDPADAAAPDPSHGHDALDVVADLNELLYVVAQLLALPGGQLPPLVFVANSIGCAVARLYAQVYPRRVHALLLADSIIANSHYGLIIPDPDKESIPDEMHVTPEMLRRARAALNARFHPDVGNAEGFSRKNLKELLPHANAPKLLATPIIGPYVTVLEHDPVVAPEIVELFTHPFWHAYNKGLVEITNAERRRGPTVVPGAGHFIHATHPSVVATETVDLVVKVLLATCPTSMQ
ncbi:hypothetical protein SPRG_09209 [Saprolegnia parasitica CBS 223.65]|uniref:AB hydrolase-1 domain-containing protein n=1 Tax=Saprolegnia parasitica (strain CBS 223.65) TaxID=695850 RepID=A0A067C7C6_SAPPC|nr:hypothetical protein SPRG_09209 [Saprolegnia parasitica CBS 223.65]KDO25070.1 hypothetical protein SPRG_09209 [Saprolegnia parasitica CBS 223.65]|eukprot:XP_012204144.1 hypothetical protein SPRG_09209 [Saprolegnia parasitica CBS 223.65]